MSALIFVALAAAWAVYLVPKALKQSEDAEATRSVESFSDRLRVLDPRKVVETPAASEAVAATAETAAADVTRAEVEEDEYVLEPVRLTPLQMRLRRQAARQAAQRRRRVLGTLLLGLGVVAGLALSGRMSTAWILAPLALIGAWLVACRLMVKKETAARTRVVKKRRTTLADQVIAAEDAEVVEVVDEVEAEAEAVEDRDITEEIPAVGVASASTWEPVPMTLPTYVAKAPASRTVRTIDLDSTGVWTSGRHEIDSELAREADAQRRAERESSRKGEAERRATGS